MSNDPYGLGRTVTQINYMMKFREVMFPGPDTNHYFWRTYWRCVRCGKRVESDKAAMRHVCGRVVIAAHRSDFP